MISSQAAGVATRKPSQRLHPHRYYVGYAGLSTFDRTLVDIRATQNQYDARMARPDNCTFSVGKNKQRGVADHVPNAPAGVYMRHFRSLPSESILSPSVALALDGAVRPLLAWRK